MKNIYDDNATYGRFKSARVRKLKFRRRLSALLLAISLGVGGFVISKLLPNTDSDSYADTLIPVTTSDPNYVPNTPTIAPTAVPTEVPTPEPTAIPTPVITNNGYNRGDSIVATKDVNMRYNTSTKSFKMGVLPKGSVVDRILSDGEWDLVRAYDSIFYVHSDYTQTNDVDYNQEYYHMEPYNDIVYTTSKLYFRLGPSTNEKDLFLCNKDEELVVIGKSINNNDPSDVWYLVKARGQIGFVKASYTTSVRESLSRYYPDLQGVSIQKMAYIKNDTNLYSADWSSSKNVSRYQLVEVLQEEGDYYLVNYSGKIGYVSKNDVKSISGCFIAVDLSDQRVFYYCGTDMIYKGRCTTGKKSSPTQLGYYTPKAKRNSHYFGPDHNDVSCYILWMPFNPEYGQGLHDAPWEADSKFGDASYTKNNGSAGCVRLTDEAATFIYDNADLDTKVLIKQ